MARLFMTGFEAGHLDASYDSIPVTGMSISSTQARTGTYSSLQQNSGAYGRSALAGNPSEVFGRVAIYPTNQNGNGVFLTLQDSAGGNQITFGIVLTTHEIEVRCGAYNGTVIGTSSAAITFNVWNCIEFRLVVDDTAGILTCKINGATEIDETDIDTQATANANVGYVCVGASPANGSYRMWGYWDDVAINDTSGTVNNSWVGRGGIYGLKPSAAGTHTDFTPDSGDNYSRVDDVPPDDDTSYVESDQVGDIDTYALEDLTPTEGAITAVKWIARAKLAEAGTGDFQRVLRHNGADYNGSDLSVDVSYAYFTEILDQAPDSTEWSIAKVNALEAGMELS